jgi:hypothetical protein
LNLGPHAYWSFYSFESFKIIIWQIADVYIYGAKSDAVTYEDNME